MFRFAEEKSRAGEKENNREVADCFPGKQILRWRLSWKKLLRECSPSEHLWEQEGTGGKGPQVTPRAALKLRGPFRPQLGKGYWTFISWYFFGHWTWAASRKVVLLGWGRFRERTENLGCQLPSLPAPGGIRVSFLKGVWVIYHHVH